MYCSLNAMNPFSSTDLQERKVSYQAEPWQVYCLPQGMSQKMAQVFFGHAVYLHQVRDIINGYKHVSPTDRDSVQVCVRVAHPWTPRDAE